MADVLRRTVKTGSEKLAESSRPARRAPRVSKSRGKTELTGGANIEGRISPRKVITEDSKGNRVQKEVDIKTANALLDIGAIVSLGNGFFLDADLALSADGVNVEDYKFGEGRIDRLGLGIGKKFDDGQIGIKGTYNPDRKDATVGIGGSFKFNKGGEVQMQKQMEMFQDGGLNDQGGSKDPVSGNDVPSGSLKEEVRDDIDAKLSPGEFVFPADVVRFIGLEKLMLMRDKAKRGLARMEEMGQMGNSEEATIDDDVPFGMEDLIIVAGSPDNEMSKGGVPSYGRGGMLLGFDGYVPPTTYYNPDTGQEMTSTKIGGNFFPPLPKGFIEKPQKVETKPRDVKTETTRVESELGSGEVDGGPDRGDKSFGEMSPDEQISYGQDLTGPFGGVIGGIEKGLGYGIEGMLGPGIAGNIAALGVETVTGQPVSTNMGIVDQIERNQNRAIDLALSDISAVSPSVAKAARDDYEAKQKASASYQTAVDYGVSVEVAEQHADDVSRGNAPPGSVPNAFGGYTTFGKYGFSTDANKDIIGGKKGKKEMDRLTGLRDKKEKAEKEKAKETVKERKERKDAALGLADLEKSIEKAKDLKDLTDELSLSNFERKGMGTDDTPDVEGVEAVGGKEGSQSDDTGPAGTNDNQDTGGFGGGVEGSKGGFIPKRKKQKKMKRGGLASR